MDQENLTNLAEVITSGDLRIIVLNGVMVLLAIVGVYFHSRIKKSGELTEINNNFTKVIEQQKIITQQTEQIKHSLERETIAYQIRLSSYNEKMICAVEAVYHKMIDLKNCAQNIGFSRSDETQQSFVKAVFDFRQQLETEVIWLPKPLAEKIENLAIEIDSKCHNFMFNDKRFSRMENMTSEQISKICDLDESFLDFLNVGIKHAFNELINDIVEVIGEKPNKSSKTDAQKARATS